MAGLKFGLTDKQSAQVKKAFKNKGDVTEGEWFKIAARRLNVAPEVIKGHCKGKTKAKPAKKPAPNVKPADTAE